MTSSRFNLPGLNLPLNWAPREWSLDQQWGTATQGESGGLYRTALNDRDVTDGYCSLPLTTLREFTMLHIMDSLSDKPGWETKVFDEEISEKWKTEALATEGRDVTSRMMDWVIAELRYKAKAFKETGTVVVYNGDVVKSDTAIPGVLQEALKVAVRRLEDVPEARKDYHPGSDKKVLDIVHPSLYPLIYGQSRILENSLIGLDDCIDGYSNTIIIPTPPDGETSLHSERHQSHSSSWRRSAGGPNPYSKNFQWLPCEVDVSGTNRPTEITSYINNLHPKKHRDLYHIIEKIITRTLPLWNLTLAPLENLDFWQRIKYELDFDPDPEKMSEPPREEGENEDDWYDRLEEWREATRKAVPPEPLDFEPPESPTQKVDLAQNYRDRGLQIIVKLANIELSPEKASYDGGTWHVEGQLNEHICATALYYYDSENITESRLAFRQQSNQDEAGDMPYPQSVHGWLTEIFGCANEEAAVQEVGSVQCREGRLLTFPNILQHQVQPFELVDKTRSGHRKILALFLVDPNIRIISTANVPPQRKDWWTEEVMKSMATSGKALGKLSGELKDMVFKDVDFPINMDTAKDLRLKLMEERSAFVEHQKSAFEQNTFSLCEH